MPVAMLFNAIEQPFSIVSEHAIISSHLVFMPIGAWCNNPSPCTCSDLCSHQYCICLIVFFYLTIDEEQCSRRCVRTVIFPWSRRCRSRDVLYPKTWIVVTEFKAYMVTNLLIAANKYSPSDEWHVETLLKILSLVNDLCHRFGWSDWRLVATFKMRVLLKWYKLSQKSRPFTSMQHNNFLLLWNASVCNSYHVPSPIEGKKRAASSTGSMLVCWRICGFFVR